MTISGLEGRVAHSGDDLIDIINYAFQERTTHSTSSNEVSSRSHAICEIKLYEGHSPNMHSKFSICDLAGSERGQDVKHNDSSRRAEGAKINVSLLALKECIRSISNKESHVPYRSDTLTKVLRDAFVCKNGQENRIVMMACVNPVHESADHTLNTLRYADRLSEREQEVIHLDINFDIASTDD